MKSVFSFINKNIKDTYPKIKNRTKKLPLRKKRNLYEQKPLLNNFDYVKLAQ